VVNHHSNISSINFWMAMGLILTDRKSYEKALLIAENPNIKEIGKARSYRRTA